MEYFVLPSCTSPPETGQAKPSKRTCASESGQSSSFEQVLNARKSEAEAVEKEALEAGAAAAAAAAAGQQIPALVEAPPPMEQAQPEAAPAGVAAVQAAPVPTAQAGQPGIMAAHPAAALGLVSPTGMMDAALTGSAASTAPTSAPGQIGTLTTEQPTVQTGNVETGLTQVTGQSPAQPAPASTEPAPLTETPVTSETAPAQPADAPLPAQEVAPASTAFVAGQGPDGMQQGALTADAGQAAAVQPAEAPQAPAAEAVVGPAASPALEAAPSESKAAQSVEPAASERETAAQRRMESLAEDARAARESTSERDPQPAQAASQPSSGVDAARTSAARETQARPETQAAVLAHQIQEGMEAAARTGRNSWRLQLTPKDLGAIDIRLVTGPQGVSLTVLADQASTGRLLEAQINQLRQNLEEAGVRISNLNIQQNNQNGQFSQGANQNFQGQPNAHRYRGMLLHQPAEEAPALPASLLPSRGIDYRA